MSGKSGKKSNGRKKKYLIKSINFGQPGDPPRELLQEYEKKFGKNKTSEYIRNLVFYSLSSSPEFDKFKIKNLIEERKRLFYNIKQIQAQLSLNYEKLNKLGLTDNQISDI